MGVCITPVQLKGTTTTRAQWTETGVSWEIEQLGKRYILQKNSKEKELQTGGHREMPAVPAELKQQASDKETWGRLVGEHSRAGGTSVMAASNSLSHGNPGDVPRSSGAIRLCSGPLPSLPQSLKTQINRQQRTTAKGG